MNEWGANIRIKSDMTNKRLKKKVNTELKYKK